MTDTSPAAAGRFPDPARRPQRLPLPIALQSGAYDAESLRAFAFDASDRAMVNDIMTDTLGERYDQLSHERSQTFVERFDPGDHPAMVTDWKAD